MKATSFCVGLVASCLIGGVAQADTFIYNIHLPNITDAGAEDDSATTAYPYSWVGPQKFNAAPNTDCPTLCGPPLGTTVNSNYFFAGFTFTADLSVSDAETKITFDQFANHSNQIVFSFVEPDSFWSTTGTGLSFPAVDGTPSFTFLGGSPATCSGCTIDISEVASTPEPRSAILLAALIGIGVMIERRRKQVKGLS
jgi:hypothetical protein